MGIFKNFQLFKKGIENWFSVTLNMLILKRPVKCKIKNVGSIQINGGENLLNSSLFRAVVSANSQNLTNEQMNNLKTYLDQFKNEIITITNLEDGEEIKFYNTEVFTIFESFFYGEYDYIPYCKDKKILIDIGGNIGDTALYFANKGYVVFAFEPIPDICDIAKKNINLNPHLKENIMFINKAVSYKSGTLTINYDEKNSAISGEFNKSTKKVEVQTITINDIINEFEIKPEFLKIDCEGCEVGIIKNSDLSMFSEIIMEYHTNFTSFPENELINLLEKQGFELANARKGETEGTGIIYMKK